MLMEKKISSLFGEGGHTSGHFCLFRWVNYFLFLMDKGRFKITLQNTEFSLFCLSGIAKTVSAASWCSWEIFHQNQIQNENSYMSS